MSERRCPSCGALVAADADWCGQCLTPLRAAVTGSPAATPRPAGGATRPFAPGPDGGGAPLSWRCPTCEAENAFEDDACRSCGTSFGRLFDEPAQPQVASPGAAAAWSLVLPGLGHWLAGRKAEAVARFVLAGWVVGMLAVLAGSGTGASGTGSSGLLVGLYAVAAVALWAEASVDAHRAAAGRPPAVSSRTMLWACVALVGLSILLATVLALPALRAGGAGVAPID
jgi:hypothetical protein